MLHIYQKNLCITMFYYQFIVLLLNLYEHKEIKILLHMRAI